MASRCLVALAVLGSVAAESFVTGGTLKLNWKDCGDASTHGKVTGLVPDSLTLGQKTTATGSGTVDEAVTGGAFEIHMKAGIISKSWTGDMCSAKTFTLPLGAGTITWDGMKCPLAAGSTSVGTDITMSSALPSSLAKATIQITATATSGDKLLCLEIDTLPEMQVVDTCSLYAIEGDVCGQSDIDCKWVKEAKLAEKSLQDGACADHGYTVKGSTETKTYPIIGEVVVTKFTKPVAQGISGGTLKLSWKDCGDASTHGKITGLVPDSLTLGQQTTATGTGTVDEVVTGGSFEIDVKAGIISKKWTGDVCAAKTFDLPLGAGSITWDGMKCPVAAGTTSVGTDIKMSSSLPSSLAKASIQIKATATSGDKLLCMEIDTVPELGSVIV
jgi:hypothetical protein